MGRLDELTAKYQSALDRMSQHGIQINEVDLRDNKLFVQGTAPSQDAKNAAWNDIKSIDSSYSDLTCDLKVGSATGTGTVHDMQQGDLSSGLAAAFRSDQTPAFPSMLSNLFGNSDGQQRAGLLNHLLSAAGPSLLGSSLPGPLANILKSGGTVTPEQAQQISPEAVQNMAEHAEKSNPSIIEQASSFYAQHPKVIQALGAGALAMILSNMKKR